MQYTRKMALVAVQMFCNGIKAKQISREFGIFDGDSLVYRGMYLLYKKYNLNVERDPESYTSFLIRKQDKKLFLEYAEKELAELRKDDDVKIDDVIKKEYVIELIEGIKNERIDLQKQFRSLMDKILKIEKHIMDKNKKITG